MNPTIRKFGYPETLVGELDHWLVLLRPAQVTAGSLILAAKSDAQSLAALDPAAFTEMRIAVQRIEQLLAAAVNFDKINYLMLMMVDPEVHFHVIPRYAGERLLAGTRLADRDWPGPPDLASAVHLDVDASKTMTAELRERWKSLGREAQDISTDNLRKN